MFCTVVVNYGQGHTGVRLDEHDRWDLAGSRPTGRLLGGLVLVVVLAASPSAIGAATAVEPVATGLSFPVAITFAPDGRLFFNERLTGRVRVLERGRVQPDPVAHVAAARLAEGGLLGIALDPDFPRNGLLYVSYTVATGDSAFRLRVSRLTVVGGRAASVSVTVDDLPAAGIRTGGLLKIGPDGRLYVTVGDVNRPTLAQDPQSLAGKVLRYNLDGSIPSDNPFPGSPVFTLGHGNVFGMAFHPISGLAYVTDNGPDRDDELNVLQAGANYGWPIVRGKAGDVRFVDPILTFTPTIAPTGVAFYTGNRYPGRSLHNLFFGAWNTGQLYRVMLAPPVYRRVLSVEAVLPHRFGGIVEVTQGADGFLYFSTRSAIYRITRLP